METYDTRGFISVYFVGYFYHLFRLCTMGTCHNPSRAVNLFTNPAEWNHDSQA